MNTQNDRRATWRSAWRECRALNWGTLHFCYPRAISDAARHAYNGRKAIVINGLHARRFGLATILPRPLNRLP